MNSGSIAGQCNSFRDYKEICRRAEIIMLDHQAAATQTGFQHNGEAGKLVHGLLGWDKLIPDSMAMYQAGRPTFRLASKPEPEARMWMARRLRRRASSRGGTMIGAYHEDRRMYRTAESHHAAGTRTTRSFWSTAGRWPQWAWCGRSRTRIFLGAITPTS